MAEEANNLSEPQFRQRLAAGDHAAFNQLIERNWRYIVLFVHGCAPSLDLHEVEDIAQESFCRVWEHRQRISVAGDGNLRSLLSAFARNVAAERLRRRATQTHSPLTSDLPCSLPSAEDEAYCRELERCLQDAMVKLTKAQRESLELKSAGLSAKETAEQLDCSPQAVKRRWQSASQHLREHLRDEGHAE